MTQPARGAAARDVEFIIERKYDAPRERAFAAWTERERLKRWRQPEDYILRICTLDLRPGGVFHYCAQRPNGPELWGKFVYHEIVPSARLVFVSSFSDETGCSTHNSHASERPLEILNIWTFQDHGGRTILTGRGVPHAATEAQRIAFAAGRKALRRGLGGPLNRLADYLGSIAR